MKCNCTSGAEDGCLSKYLRSTPLLDALRISKINKFVEVNTVRLFKSVMFSTTWARELYSFLLYNINNVKDVLCSRFVKTCQQYDLRQVQILFDDNYMYQCYKKIKRFPTDNGLVDSCTNLLKNYSNEDKKLLKLLLRY